MTLKRIIIFFFLFSLMLPLFSQQLFESDIIYGGITGGGFSTNTGSGTVVSNVAIPPNSTIKKAYLFATRDGVAPDIDVVLNGNIYTFTNASVLSNKFISGIHSTWTWANSTINAIDITNDMDSSIMNYSLIIPPQFNITINGFYSSFYLFIIYENPILSKLAYNLFINEQDVAITSTYNLVNFSPINNNNPVGLGMWSTFFCDTIQDGSYVEVNSNQLGLLGGVESNTIHSCTGVYSNFSHYNDSLFGLEDDTPDSLMSATDALADIKSYVNNNGTNIKVIFTYQTPTLQNGKYTNPIAALMLSYSTPCDTFSTTATTNKNTICVGDSVQLNATGGVSYSWFGAFGGLNDSTLANPIAKPTQTTTYIVTIKNDSGCVKTEHVKIVVNPAPVILSTRHTPADCGSNNGAIVVEGISSNTAPYSYTFNSITTSQNILNGLPANSYKVTVTDKNNCSYTLPDSIVIDSTSQFQFATSIVTPDSGIAPLEVTLSGQVQRLNNFKWSIIDTTKKDTLATYFAKSAAHTFDSSGVYEVAFVAYNNYPTCADTATSYVIVMEDGIIANVPKVFTPNGDGINDAFSVSFSQYNLLQSITITVYNRWGNRLHSNTITTGLNNNNRIALWDGTTSGNPVPDGTYFYTLTYVTQTNMQQTLNGTVMLLR